MRNNVLSLLSALTACFVVLQLSAQNTSPYWSLAGNSNASSTTSKLGTTNAIPLRLFTNNAERMRIDASGNVGMGTGTVTLGSKLVVNGATGSSPFRAMVNGTTKLKVNSNGGLSVGSSSTPPANGLYVAGNVGMGTATPSQKLHVVGNGYFTGKLGINTSPSYPLDIKNTSYQYGIRVINSSVSEDSHVGIFTDGGVYGYGIWGIGGYAGVLGQGDRVGVEGDSYENKPGDHIGVSGWSFNSDDEGEGGIGYFYGVYGEAGHGEFNAAGYFSGDVWAANYITTSDRKFKTGITPLTNSLEQLMKLKPSAYEFKTAEYAKMGLPRGKQMGLIADEVKQVFPELVKQGVHPAKYSKDRKTVESPEVKYEGVNYQSLIPVLIASIQELKAENEALKAHLTKENEALKARLTKLESLLSNNNGNTSLNLSLAYLEQNTPNPFNNNTTIRYHLPSNASSAKVVITDMKGAVIRSIALNSKGSGQITLHDAALAAGSYTYSLWVDNQPVDTKQMLVTR